MYSIKNLQRNAWSKRGGPDPLDPPPPSAPAQLMMHATQESVMHARACKPHVTTILSLDLCKVQLVPA